MPEQDKKSDKKSESENEITKNKSLIERTSFFEWIVAAVGLILVLFSIGFVSYQAITSKDTPPNLLIKSITIKQQSNGYLAEFTVENEGERTAANVIIEGKLSNGETKTTTIAYVASKSKQKGGLFFEKDPRKNNLEIRAVGYENP